MTRTSGPTVRQRRLGIELRRLREQNAMKGDEVAARLGWSTAKVSRLENARTGARTADVESLLKVYGVAGPRLAELLKLADEAAQKGWWEQYPGLPTSYAELISLETEADRLLVWEDSAVPGLLQTADYVRRTVSKFDVVATKPPAEIERLIEVRLLRSEVLHREPPLQYEVVLSEGVLLRAVGSPPVMADQIAHLREVSRLPNVTLRVMPLRRIHPIDSSSFTLLAFSPVHDVTFPDIVHTESIAMSYLENEQTTYMYRLAFTALAEAALSPEDSREFLSQVHDEWTRTQQ